MILEGVQHSLIADGVRCNWQLSLAAKVWGAVLPRRALDY